MFSQPRTLPCPHCNEIINDSMDHCPFCSKTIDHNAAAAAAELQEKVNQAYSDASYTRPAAIAMYVFLGLSFIPLIPLVMWGFIATFIVVIVMVARWQLKFGKLKTEDPDYRQAVYRKNVALFLWLFAIPIGFILQPLLGGALSDLMLSS